jgi:hypothetical protein
MSETETCGICQRAMDSPMSVLTASELAQLHEMTKTEGWKLYLGILRLDLSDAIEAMISRDGDVGRMQTRCREMKLRLTFEECLEARTNELLQEDEVPVERLLGSREDDDA